MVGDSHPIDESDLLGRWQIHYNTHDYEFCFESNGRFELLGLIDGKMGSLRVGSWHVAGNRIIWQPEKAPYESADIPQKTWTINVMGSNCFAIDDGYPSSYTLQRVK